MNNVQSLNYTAWECKYHLVWIPKYRKKKLFGRLRVHLGTLIKDLARQKESPVVEGHLMGDYVLMLLTIPPKYAVSQVIGFIKGKRATHIARTYIGQRKNFTEHSTNTSRNRKKKTNGLINSTYLNNRCYL
jgi:putative transposase